MAIRLAVLMAICLSSGAVSATAQSAESQGSQAQGNNGQSVFIYPAPPDGFDPTIASDAELAEYGYPPRPDQSEPAVYAHWQKIVRPSIRRLTNVQLRTTNVRHRHQGTIAATSTGTSSTPAWSGYVLIILG
jgi:hypothetical protein